MPPNWRHIRWEKTGRTVEVLDEFDQPYSPARYAWVGGVGEQCIHDGQDYQPYIWDSGNNELRYSNTDNRIVFASDRQLLKSVGNIVCNSFKLFVQRKIGQTWTDQPHGLPTRNFLPNKRYEGGVLTDSEGCAVGFLEFPDAAYDLQIGMQTGRKKYAQMGYRFRAPIDATIRMQIVLDGIEDKLGGFQLLQEGGGRLGREIRTVGVVFKDVKFRWTWEEAAYHTISVEDSIDYPGQKNGVITVGPFDYTKNTWVEVLPLTWGPTEASDDCHNYGTTYEDNYSGHIFVGKSGAATQSIGWIWDVVVAQGVTVGAGTKITVTSAGEGGDAPSALLKAVNEFEPPAWGTTERPDTKTVFATNQVEWNLNEASGAHDSPELNGLINEIISDGSWVSGNKLAVVWMDNGSASSANQEIVAEESGNGATLTIVYTAAGGAVDVDATLDALVIDEYAAGVNKEVSFVAGVDALAITEYAATVNKEVAVTAGVDALTLTEYAATVNKEISISAGVDALVITEYAATVQVGADIDVSATVDALTLAEYAATVNKEISISAGTDALVITEYAATINKEISLTAGIDALVITEFAATVNKEISISAGVDALIIAEYAASVNKEISIQVTLESLVIAEYAASVSVGAGSTKFIPEQIGLNQMQGLY